MKDLCTFSISFIISFFIFYYVIPKRNPYTFPDPMKIDKYTYIDANGVCYKYKRKYIDI